MWRKRLVVFLGSFLMVSMVMAGTVLAEQTFKLGVLGPFTGPAAKSGTEMKDAATMAFEEVDYKIGNYKIELVYIDDQSDPAKGTNAYSEAIERKGVQAGILNWNTAVTVACMDLWSKYKVPHFFCMGAGEAVNNKWFSMPEEDRYLIIKGWPVPQKMVVGYADCISNAVEKGVWKPEKKLVALWGEDTDWGRGIVAAIGALLKEKGWEVFTEDYFPLTQTDFYAFLGKCKKAGAVLLAGNTTGTASISAITKQARELRFKGFIIADGLAYIGNWYKLTGPASDGVLDMQPQISTPEQKAWAEKFKKRFGYPPSPAAAGQSYDYGNFFIKVAKRAIEKYGELNSKTLTKVGREEVATGDLRYSKQEGAIMHARYGTDETSRPDPTIGQNDFYFPVIQYKKGVGSVVFPENMKQADLMVP